MRSLPFPSPPIRVLPLALVVALAACSMEPTYQRPDAPIPSAYPNGPAYSTPGANAGQQNAPAAADLGWRQFFVDPQLQQLIARALANNRDLRIATLNIDAARAQYRLQRAAQFPEIDANLGLNSQRLSPGLRAPGQSPLINTFSAGVGLTNFEIDLFGRVRSMSHAAQEQYLATVEAQRSVHISLVAEVGNAYLTLMADRELLKLAQDTLKNQQDVAAMIHRGKLAGGMAQLDEHRADTQVQTAQVAVEQYTRQVAQDENALTLLIGGGPLPAGVTNAMPLGNQHVLAEFPEGLPSTLLERRPDIMAAEHRLIAANANIGAARAAFFPRITLTGMLGVASATLAGLFSGGAAWLFAPQLTMPIFDGGRNSANLDLATVEKDVNVANYERTIQSAFREVADSMAARTTFEREVNAQQKMIHDISETQRLAQMRFQNGVDDYFGVFDAQRQLFQAQQLLVTYKLAGLTSRVTLYKALGGGWQESNQVAGAQQPAAKAQPAAAARPGATAQSKAVVPPAAAAQPRVTSVVVTEPGAETRPNAAAQPGAAAQQGAARAAAPSVTTKRSVDSSGVTAIIETTVTPGTTGGVARPGGQ
ncbi:efflux transporter outer membrane subunit [Burkholderia ubonensis]|uniref:efflux transporter outer membrane subunit n=1 Tax=Burkholderia ubonensis TaxID=101571 RepID=UPI000BA72E74|nr:efflux transporter outer membrane subunit [Burkholderia ubonensis]PAK14341.1 RND transporter [Burkholderia ubonensis]RQP39578.1 RND transporter [Burkholderia ubonensis]RQP39877.1 RND transporter [Burkholderia ubonensis]RQP47814.1 RND transporter [Burkholderia ubonensis]RQP50608.1 RND transporter [Burkholderia ubonensis]